MIRREPIGKSTRRPGPATPQRGRVEIDPYTNIHAPGVTIIGAHANTTPAVETVASRWTARANFALALDLPATEAVGVFEAIVAHPDEYLGVLFDWRDSG